MTDALSLTLHIENATQLKVPTKARFRQWASVAIAGRREAAELSIKIVDEREGAELNQRYRGKTGPTNILSFGIELPAELKSPLLGDLVICGPVVLKEAHEQNKPATHHWAHLVIHGCLHLLGFDHGEESAAEEMESLEITLLANLGIKNPYLAEFQGINNAGR